MKLTTELKEEIEYYLNSLSAPTCAREAIDRLEEIDLDDPTEAIMQAVDDSLIYYEDQWEVLQWACDPINANWETAIDILYNTVYDCIWRAVKDYDEDEENKEDELNVK